MTVLITQPTGPSALPWPLTHPLKADWTVPSVRSCGAIEAPDNPRHRCPLDQIPSALRAEACPVASRDIGARPAARPLRQAQDRLRYPAQTGANRGGVETITYYQLQTQAARGARKPFPGGTMPKRPAPGYKPPPRRLETRDIEGPTAILIFSIMCNH